MSDNSNKLSRFWQELKRRNVVRVFTVYAAAAFMILEFVDIVGEPLGLPDWTLKLVLALLSFGLIIALIVSWIFDVTPKGVEKTKPLSEIQEAEKTVHPGFWKIATYASVVIIIGLISFNIISRNKISPKLELYGKSIAVLPFINDSQNDEDDMFINGTMESILNNLCKIKDLRVISRSSVEQYRDAIVPIPEIAKAMMAAYILEGSMQKIGQRIRLTVQLIDQNDRHVWSEQYDREIKQLEDLFSLQSEIAELVAREINVVITPDELQRIEKVPTTDTIAYQLCLAANSELREWRHSSKQGALENANRLFRQALKRDSSYADAITGLAEVYLLANVWGDRSKETYLDSVIIYADQSLSYDDENWKTYRLLGTYYYRLGDWAAAERSCNKSLEFNPNNPVVYLFLGHIYKYGHGDYVKAIKNYEEAEKTRGGQLITAPFYREISGAYMYSGFFDITEERIRNALEFDGDSAIFFSAMGNVEKERGNYKKAAGLKLRAYNKVQYFGFIELWNLIYSDQIEEANRWIKLSEEENSLGWWDVEQGYLSSINGEKEKAEHYFSKFMDEFNKVPKHGRWDVSVGDWLDEAAMIYAYRGQKDKAYSCLDELVEMKNSLPPSVINHLEINPMFENIREEGRFQKILRKMEADYQAAHERMRLYLKETGRL